MGKGAGTAQAQLDKQNALQQQALDQQKAIRDQIMGSLNKYLTGSGEGLDPAQLAAMKAQFLNTNTANFNAAGSSIMSSLRSRGVAGGDTPAGGDFTRGLEALQGARASSQSQGLLNTDIQNLQQAISNRFNAAQVAGGQTAQLGQNVGIFGQGANNSLDQYIKARNAPGLLNNFVQGLGSGLGAIATGGIGSALGGISGMLKSSPSSGPADFSGFSYAG